jgi:hypothetical protein
MRTSATAASRTHASAAPLAGTGGRGGGREPAENQQAQGEMLPTLMQLLSHALSWAGRPVGVHGLAACWLAGRQTRVLKQARCVGWLAGWLVGWFLRRRSQRRDPISRLATRPLLPLQASTPRLLYSMSVPF